VFSVYLTEFLREPCTCKGYAYMYSPIWTPENPEISAVLIAYTAKLSMKWRRLADRPTNVLYQLDNRSRTGVQSICIHYSSQAIITPARFITLVADSFARGASVAAAPQCRTFRDRRGDPSNQTKTASTRLLITS